MTSKLLYNRSTIIRHGTKQDPIVHRAERMILLLTYGPRGLPMSSFPAWTESIADLPVWLIVKPQGKPKGVITWAYEVDGDDGGDSWAYSDRLVVVEDWPCYFRMAHWPESIFRLGTHTEQPQLSGHGHEHLCAKQDIYYHEARMGEVWDPFDFLK